MVEIIHDLTIDPLFTFSCLQVTILKRMRESKLDAAFEDDSELTHELEKYREMSQESDRNANCRDGDDFWRRTPDPEDLFTNLEF